MNHEDSATLARLLLCAISLACLAAGIGCARQTAGGDLRTSRPLTAFGESRQTGTQWQPAGREQPPPADPRRLPMFDGADAQALQWSDLVARASAADIVIIGETHGHPVGLDAAACLFDDILEASDDTALAMEFFERDQQAALDDYLSGITDEEAFRKATGRTDGSYPDGHRRMVEAAKAHGRPVAAANAPRRYVRLARTEGFDRLGGLSDSQKRLYVVPGELSEGRYRDEFMTMMGAMEGHGAAGGVPETATEEEKEKARQAMEQALSFFRSQNVWDATMAESIVRLVAAGSRPVVMVVGRFHSEFNGGLTQRVAAALPSARILTLTMVDEESDALREEDKERSAVVIYVGKTE